MWELPAHAEVLARSDKTGVEMFRLGDRAMGVQGHPEYSKDILMSIADRLLRQNLLLVNLQTNSFFLSAASAIDLLCHSENQ